MSKNKQKGTSAETAVVNWLVSYGNKNVERRALQGSLDRGDISGLPGVVIEVKNHATMKLAEWVAELNVEMQNDNSTVGAVIHKKRGTTNVGEWYATMPVKVWYDLLKEAGY